MLVVVCMSLGYGWARGKMSSEGIGGKASGGVFEQAKVRY